MKSFIMTLVLFTAISSEINGDPFIFFPRHMLPPVGITFNLTFNGVFNKMKVSGVYAIQAVTDQDMTKIIGYRNWQSYTGEFTGIFYGVSYVNGSYPQALVDPSTDECTNAFVEIMDCTSWSNTQIVRWDSDCTLTRIDPPITGDMQLTLRASTSDLKRPESVNATASLTGIPDKTTVTFEFLTKAEQKNFPNVICPF